MTPGLDPLDGGLREGRRGDLSGPGPAPDDTPGLPAGIGAQIGERERPGSALSSGNGSRSGAITGG